MYFIANGLNRSKSTSLTIRKIRAVEGGETVNKTKMAIIAGIVLCVIVGCIAGGVFN